MDSPTRRSSIPILKQTNKTKSFQSYVNLNLNDDSTSVSSSSSCTSPSVMSSVSKDPPKLPIKPNSLIKSNSVNANSVELDNDIIITKLIEENKKMKDSQQNLIVKYEEALRENMEIQHQNDLLQKSINEAKHTQSIWKEKIGNLEEKLEKENSEKIQLRNSVKMLKQEIEMLKSQQLEYDNTTEKNKRLQKKLEEILPENLKDLVGDENFETPLSNLANVNLPNDLKNIMNELEKLKIYLNKADLQLYEANEKISELEDENLTLKAKNKELAEYVKIMSTNIKENMDANKKIQETFKLVKEQRDELIMRNRDSIDSPKTLNVNEEIHELKTELKRQKAVYEAQFIEYNNVKEELLAKTKEVEDLTSEVATLKEQLKCANERGDKAEETLKKLKEDYENEKKKENEEMNKFIPPPPPPPMNFFSPIAKLKPSTSTTSLSDAINQTKLQSTDYQVQKPKGLEGLDAVMSDLRNTIKRRKKSSATPTTVVYRNKDTTDNETTNCNKPSDSTLDRSFIINLVESSSKQNRKSIKMCDNELSMMFSKFNINQSF